ncbi:MAG TPA: aminodeoxychorismate synthase component I, partial [Gemmatimonadaceae bacterium]|nr:aminodeoxychorismate synthase component I [Gemmatimonadaceae bacterium]
LYQLVGTVTGFPPIVVRNDELTWDQFLDLAPDRVILSPGPGHPDNVRDFGICRQILLDANVPVLGVCLGLQGLASVFGGTITHGPEPRHGRLSMVHHDGSALFEGIPRVFQAVRYHSLIVAQPVPDCLRITARTEDNLVMGLEHRERPLFGVQFHPESIATEHGEQLLRNFIGLVPDQRADEPKRSSRPHTHWQTFSRKLTTYPTAEDTFCELFAFERPAFWLDSSDGEARRSRFSFMGTGALIQDVPVFDYLKNELRDRHCSSPELPFDFNGGFVGYFGYELKSETGGAKTHRSPYPDSRFLFVDRFLAFDHQERCLYLVFAGTTAQRGDATAWLNDMEQRLETVSVAPAPRPAERASFSLEQDREAYLADVETCLEEIRNGESYEICLTNRLRATSSVDPLDYYRVLRRLNPAPYSAFLRFNELSVACSSPERFLKIDRACNVESRPIKGTLRRSSDPAEDERLRETLQTSVKTRAENLMIVDLLRNDLGRVCELGSVHVPQMMQVETYANLHQLVSTIRGRLRRDVTAIDCIRSAFPGGSMTGAPKLRTMEIIDRLEHSARGVYSGAIGFLALNGTADLNIVIRTAVFHGRQVSIGIGGAIVALSDPAAEFDEALLKGQKLLDALNGSRVESGPLEKSFQRSTADPKPPERRPR